MYLWAALFSVAVVSLSIVRSPSVVFLAATLVAVLALLPATMPRLRPWRSAGSMPAPPAKVAVANVPAARPLAAPLSAALPPAATPSAAPVPADSLPRAGRLPGVDPVPGLPAPNGHGPASPVQVPFPSQAPPFPSQDPYPGTAPFPAPAAEPADGRDPFPQAQRPDARPT